jgi:hypothetical protein
MRSSTEVAAVTLVPCDDTRPLFRRGFALGRRWLDEVLGGVTIDEIADRERCTNAWVAGSSVLSRARLAPAQVPRTTPEEWPAYPFAHREGSTGRVRAGWSSQGS